MTDTPDPGESSRNHHSTPARLVRRGLFALAGAVCVLGLVVWFIVIPYPWRLEDENPERTALMAQRVAEANEDGRPFEIRQTWVELDQVSSHLVRAVLVAEDYRFRQHRGVDWVSLAEEVAWTGDDEFSWVSASDLGALAHAVRYGWQHRDELRGRSTITQQLAKNLYFGTDRTFVRKGLELVVAGRLESKLGKDRILELYLNTAEWGPGVFGAEAAAREYFGRSASSLTLHQAATLAATLPHPLSSNPRFKPARMAWRRELLLGRLDPASGLPAPPMRIAVPVIEVVTEGSELGDLQDR